MTNAHIPDTAVVVCVDARTAVEVSGRVYSTMLTEVLRFRDITEFLLRMDALFDRQGFPQAYQVKRSFSEQKKPDVGYKGRPQFKRELSEVLKQTGEVATLYIAVETRRSSSWQGTIWNPKNQKKGDFSSDLELIKVFEELLEDHPGEVKSF